MKVKNKDGTWNIWDERQDKKTGDIVGWREVPDSWLDMIPRKGISSIKFHADGTLCVGYSGERESIWYKLVYGTWGSPTRFV